MCHVTYTLKLCLGSFFFISTIMAFEFVVADVEGFPTRNGGLVLRELTLIFPNEEEQHFHFKNPESLFLDDAELKTAKFCQRHMNGFSPTTNGTSCLPASVYPSILEEIKDCRIYCAGESARYFLANHLPDSHVIDVYSLFDFRYPNEFTKNPNCFKLHRYRHCSLAKARFLAESLQGYRL